MIKVSTLFRFYGVRLIPTCINDQKSVRLITAMCPPYSKNLCPPYYYIVSALLQHSVHLIPTCFKGQNSVLLIPTSGVRFIPTVVRLIPTLFETRNCVHLNTPKRKKVSALFCKCTPYSRLLRFRLNTVHLSTVSLKNWSEDERKAFLRLRVKVFELPFSGT